MGVGTDIFKISRISPAAVSEGDAFLMRAFTEAERSGVKNGTELSYFAVRFSAKEAVFKAISCYCEEFRPGEIEILQDVHGKPHVRLLGRTKKTFEKQAGNRYKLHISISYDTEYASTFAVAEII